MKKDLEKVLYSLSPGSPGFNAAATAAMSSHSGNYVHNKTMDYIGYSFLGICAVLTIAMAGLALYAHYDNIKAGIKKITKRD